MDTVTLLHKALLFFLSFFAVLLYGCMASLHSYLCMFCFFVLQIFFGFGSVDTESDDSEDGTDDETSLYGDEEDVFLPINQEDELTKL